MIQFVVQCSKERGRQCRGAGNPRALSDQKYRLHPFGATRIYISKDTYIWYASTLDLSPECWRDAIASHRVVHEHVLVAILYNRTLRLSSYLPLS